jgi:hypothetical protein
MAEVRDFSVVLFLVLVAICAYLANVRAIGGAALAGCIVASAFSVALIRNIDRLEQLVFRRGEDQVLVQIRQIQKDVYAKVEELQRIAAGVATFTAASLVSENRFASEDHQERMLRRRDELETFLQEAGIAEARRREIVRPITLIVDWDLRRAIVIDAVAAWKPHNTPGRDELQQELQRLLQQPDRVSGLAQVEELLRKHGIASEGLPRSIEHYRRLLTSGRLPRVGPEDDMRTPPRG